MRINEVNFSDMRALKKLTHEQVDEKLGYFMVKKGFTILGYGTYGAVYQKENRKIVLKVFNEEDSGYLQFHDFCMKNKGNPHLPKLGKLIRIHDYYVVLSEYLKPMNGYKTNVGLRLVIKKYTGYDASWLYGEIESYLQNSPDGKKYMDDVTKKFEKENPLFVETLKQIMEHSTGLQIDLHGDNIMMRGNTLVITDPLKRGK